MFKGVERRLEFDKLLEETAKLARSESGKREVLQIEPSVDAGEILDAVSLTEELVKISSEFQFPLNSFPDVSSILEKLKVSGAVLSVEEVLKLRAVLIQSSVVIKFSKQLKGRFERFSSLVRGLSSFSDLRDTIDRTIDETGYILDSASEKLSSIRMEIKSTSKRIKEKLESLMAKEEELFPGRTITVRSGRYVVLTMPNFSQKFKGIVHDRSSTGHTLYVEPSFLVEDNNRLRKLRIAEKKEIERILSSLSLEISLQAEKIESAFKTLVEIDKCFAIAGMSLKLKGTFPEISDRINLLNARHPLIQISGRKVIPVDVKLEKGLVITGPNTGGKTVTLKTVGLLVLMFQSGFLIPVSEGSSIRIFKRVMADIGDEQSIEQSLSTFSSHAKNIAEILRIADSDSLVLLDELGAGTDPVEGSNLGIGILEYLKERGAKVIATTHFTPIKLYAYRDDYYAVASVMFDEETLEPLFKLAYGIIGKSYALIIAERYGMPKEVIDYAKVLMSSEDKMASQIISSLEEEHRKLVEEREKVESLKELLQSKLRELEKREAELREKGIKEIEEIISYLKDEGEKAIKSLKSKNLRAVIEAGRKKIEELESKREVEEIEKGKLVRVRRSGKSGKVLSVDKERKTAKVQIGNLCVSLKFSQLEPVEEKNVSEKGETKVNVKRPVSFFPELNVIGMRGDEALSAVEKFLDRAKIEGFQKVKIIHGYGLGILKKVIRDYLRTSPYVKSFRSGSIEEGGDGVTVVELR